MNRSLLMTHRSPFARKVRVILREKGLAYEDVLVDLAKKPHVLLRSGPIQKVPVLFDGGLTIVDSNVIAEYLEERYPAVRLFPYGYLRRADARMWEQTANEIAEAAIHVFMGRLKPPALHDHAGLAKALGLHDRALDYAEQALRGRDYLVGREFTVADVALVTACGYSQFRLGDGWRSGRPHLVAYYSRLVERPSFASTMPRL